MAARCCVSCSEYKLLEGFGKKQFRWSNGTPTCLECAEASRDHSQQEWTVWLQGEVRTCIVCEEEKVKQGFGKKQWKTSAPKCLQCAWAGRVIEDTIYQTEVQYLLGRCHNSETARLLMQHEKVQPPDVLRFLSAREWVFCDCCAPDSNPFYGGPSNDGRWWTAVEWLWFHLNRYHDKRTQQWVMATQVARVAKWGAGIPLVFQLQ